MSSNADETNQLNIEISEETAEGIYTNLAFITHSEMEFIVDFVRVMPGVPKAKVKSRVILTPEHAKRLLEALRDNITKFESEFGTIKSRKNDVAFPISFNNMGQA